MILLRRPAGAAEPNRLTRLPLRVDRRVFTLQIFSLSEDLLTPLPSPAVSPARLACVGVHYYDTFVHCTAVNTELLFYFLLQQHESLAFFWSPLMK